MSPFSQNFQMAKSCLLVYIHIALFTGRSNKNENSRAAKVEKW